MEAEKKQVMVETDFLCNFCDFDNQKEVKVAVVCHFSNVCEMKKLMTATDGQKKHLL